MENALRFIKFQIVGVIEKLSHRASWLKKHQVDLRLTLLHDPVGSILKNYFQIMGLYTKAGISSIGEPPH